MVAALLSMKSLRKINTNSWFLYKQNEYLIPELRRLLCNYLMQLHFDYTCVSLYPSVNQKIRKKIQDAKNKCIYFWLKLSSRQHISVKEFKEINWLSTKERVEQRAATEVFKYWKGTSPFYVNELFVLIPLYN